MFTVFTNSKNSKASDPHRLLLNLTGKIDLRFIIHGETKKSYKNNKFEISAPTWNEEFELTDRSYSIWDIQEYFEYILKKHGEKHLIRQ